MPLYVIQIDFLISFFFVSFIQNPTPGVMAYEIPLPYSAIDPDNAICPIPLLERPGHSSTNRYLDREVRFNNELRRRIICFIGCYSRNNDMEKYE
jgi:hypothetical protein